MIIKLRLMSPVVDVFEIVKKNRKNETNTGLKKFFPIVSSQHDIMAWQASISFFDEEYKTKNKYLFLLVILKQYG